MQLDRETDYRPISSLGSIYEGRESVVEGAAGKSEMTRLISSCRLRSRLGGTKRAHCACNIVGSPSDKNPNPYQGARRVSAIYYEKRHGDSA